MLRKIILTLFAFFMFMPSSFSQFRGKSFYASHWEKDGQDSIMVINILPVPVYKRKADMRRYFMLVETIKKVYPIAKFARDKLAETEAKLADTPNEKDQRKMLRQLEQDLLEEYKPILKKMTYSQGKVLLKLIDRETGSSSYDIIKEFRGGFVAFFWQGIAKIFTADLKATYNAEGEDKLLEQLIIYYEAGIL